MTDLASDVLDAARYLRSVRPIDPAELVEYTAAEADTAAVSAVLRDHALELDLVERGDGTFAPVPTGPIPPLATPLEALPPDRDAHIVERLAEGRGDGWASGESGATLRRRIRDLKARYLTGGTIEYDRLDADAYLAYHFPRSYAATWYSLAEAAAAGLVPHALRVLDVGAGVGASLAAIDDATPDDALIDYVAVEPSPMADHLEAVASGGVGTNTHVTVLRSAFEPVSIDEPVDLAVVGSVLSEVDDPVAFARRTLEAVAADGTWLAIAPADRRTALQLREVERSLTGAADVFSPTLRLWPDAEPTDACWSFVEHPPLAVPAAQHELAAAEGKPRAYLNETVRYSYSIMRPDGRRRFDVMAREGSALPLSRAADAVGERVDAMAVKLSGNLADSGANPLYRIGDGSQSEACFAVHVAPSSLNDALEAAPYGAVLRYRRVLVLWNDDEGAINLVVDDETTVERVTPERSA